VPNLAAALNLERVVGVVSGAVVRHNVRAFLRDR